MRIDVLSVGFDNVTMEEAVAHGEELLREPGAHYVVTPNPEIVEVCRTDAEAMEAVHGASLVLPDGIGVILGAKLLKTPLRERVPGIEFGTAMLDVCARLGKPVYLLGAKPGVAEEAAKRMQASNSTLQIAGTHDGYFTDDAAAAEAIRASGAAMVFVCLGAPKQEKWMAQYGEATGASLLIGLGGALDVFAGVAQRAPKFFCDHGLEWFYRLLREPKRIGRMMKLPLFLVHVMGARKR